MSGGSIGTIAGGIVGGIAGFFAGGNVLLGIQLGATIGGGVGTALDPPKGPKVSGPRLGDLTVQTSTYGAPIPRLYGTIAVFGNIFWLENNKLKEVVTTESSGGKGMGMMGGGGETTTYSYYATFALGLCEGPIIGIRRIWIGPKLFYDIGSTNKSTLAASKANKQYFKLYLGNDTQTADPRMQATLGAANVPGYRGRAYIVFYDLPMADYGNTLLGAQIKVEVVKSGALSYLFEQVAAESITAESLLIRTDKKYVYCLPRLADYIEVFDVHNSASPFLTASVAATDEIRCGVYDSSVHRLYLGGEYNGVIVFDLSNPAVPSYALSYPVASWVHAIAVYGDYVYAYSSQSDTLYVINFDDLNDIFTVGSLSISGAAIYAMEVDAGYLYAVDETNECLYVVDVSSPEAPVILSTLALPHPPKYMARSGDYLYIRYTDQYLLTTVDISDPESPALVLSQATSDFGPLAIAGDYLYTGSHDNSDPTNIIRAFSLSDPASPQYIGALSVGGIIQSMSASGSYIYAMNTNAAEMQVYFFVEPTIVPGTVPLSDIVSAEALKSNLLTADDIDVTTLTDEVRGYRVTEVDSIRGGIEPLRAAWPFDVVQHGYQIKFQRRGTASVATIDAGELDARDAGAEPGVQITNSREMDSILPKRVSLKYFEYNREYDQGEQYAERINTDAVNVRDFDLPIVLTAEEAAQKAEVLLYLYWMERYDISFNLPPDYSELEPADAITITSDDATYELRLTSINYTPDGRLECKSKYNSAALYIPVALGEEGQSTGVTLEERGETAFELLDIPLLQDSYDKAGFPVAMTGYLSGWPGGVLFRSDDDGQSWQAIQGFTPPGSVIGYATDTLGEHGGTVLDKSGLLTVRMYQGELSSVTEAQMFAGQNWFAYGAHDRWEIIAAQNCVLQGDGSYILSDFLRGQMGSEWATGLHAVGDRLIHLSSSELAFVDANASSIGTSRLYRAVTGGETLDSADDVEWAYEGVNLECLSPCHLTGNRHPATNDWTLTWVRRSRFAGWRSYVDADLGEASESYEVDIFSDNTYTTLKRTLAAASPTVAYTSAQQLIDFAGNQSELYLEVYQISATVGRGYPLTTSIQRNLEGAPAGYAMELLFEGADGSTTITDTGPNNLAVTANGNAHISTERFFSGSSSLVIDGVGDYLSIPDNSVFNLAGGDFTIRLRVYPVELPGAGVYACMYAQGLTTPSDFALGWWLAGTAKHYVSWSISGSFTESVSFTDAALPPVGQWSKLELVRKGSTLTIFIDDVQSGSPQSIGSATIYNSSSNINIGASDGGTLWPFNGYIDEYYVYKGLALH
jgi:hypothetical protein